MIEQTQNSDKVKEFTCICCPMGCRLKVAKSEEGYLVTGNKCPRGKKYAIEEMTAPSRVLTSTVRVENGLYPVVSVRTKDSIPKDKIFEAMQELQQVKITAPVQVGDVVVENIVGSGVEVIATHENPAV